MNGSYSLLQVAPVFLQQKFFRQNRQNRQKFFRQQPYRSILQIGGVVATVLMGLGLNPAIAPAQPQQNVPNQDLLNAHNRYRQAVGVPPLTWSSSLAASAAEWATTLAQQGTFRHDPNNAAGENIWMGTAGAFSPTQMVDAWGREQAQFVPGTFPNVSRTGNWADVGHYTQIVWRQTTTVGCAIARNQRHDILVCRYSPPGNVRGQAPF